MNLMSKMIQIESYANQLIRKLNLIEEKMMALLDLSTIKRYYNDPDSMFVLITAPYYFESSDEKQTRIQIELARIFSDWTEHIHFIVQNLPSDKKRELKELEDFVTQWIDRSGNLWGVPATIDEARKVFSAKIKSYRELLEFFVVGNDDYIFVPDTNAFIFVPDITAYRKFLGNLPYSVVIMPTVTSELDRLKVIHRDEKFREKVNSVIKRIKGWRNQGSLSQGVTVDKTITLLAVAKEPNFENTLSWLNEDNDDDKLIASTLELQRQNLSANIILVTSDINLQNKAELANLPCFETSDL
jgi:hypothetical protein